MKNNMTIQEKAIINANGTHTQKSNKMVFCLETGEVFASVTDAAEANKVHLSAMSSCCRGKTRMCNGKHFFFVSKATEHLNTVACHIRALETQHAILQAKADAYDAWQAEIEAERKREAQLKQDLIDAEAELVASENLKDELMEKYHQEVEHIKAIENRITMLKMEMAV